MVAVELVASVVSVNAADMVVWPVAGLLPNDALTPPDDTEGPSAQPWSGIIDKGFSAWQIVHMGSRSFVLQNGSLSSVNQAHDHRTDVSSTRRFS